MPLSCRYCKSQENVRQKLAYTINSEPVYWNVCAECDKGKYTKMFKELLRKNMLEE